MIAYTSTADAWWQETDLTGTGSATYHGTLSVDRPVRTWKGFGGCFNEIGWDALKRVPAAERDRVFDLLFSPDADGCRFTYNRLPIGASDFALSWYSHNETPGDVAMVSFSIDRDRGCLIPYIKEGLKRQPDMTLFASPWSPPTWMKFPAAHNFGTLIETDENLNAYALYFRKFLQAYRSEGVTIDALHVQNEPAVSQKFPSCNYTGTLLRRLITDHLHPQFQDAGEPAELWLGTINSDVYNDYIAPVLDHPRGRAAVDGVGIQWNGKALLPLLKQAHPDLPVIQTENECGDGNNSWAYARYVFNLARHYINHGAEAYVYWNFVLYEGGDSTWGWRQNSLVTINRATGEVRLTPEFTVMKHLARFVPAGSRVCTLTGTWSAHALAFVCPEGCPVIIAHTPHPEVTELAIRIGDADHTLHLPPSSITTLVGETSRSCGDTRLSSG